MKINTGKGTISLLTVMAIWSISLVVNLPGLAVTPMMGNLHAIFPHVTELEIQLLTVLPNLCIMPFVLLSGKLSVSRSKVTIVVVALVMYLISGILYMFANSMAALIVISCLLGVGCGLLIPLAAGLLADVFTGKYRMRQLGIKSGISNLALVGATFLVGLLSHDAHNWRLPFLVYLIPAIPLVLSGFLRRIPAADLDDNSGPHGSQQSSTDHDAPARTKAAAAVTEAGGTTAKAVTAHPPLTEPKPDKPHTYKGFFVGRIWGLIGVYFFICYATVVVSYYAPFLMQDKYAMSSTDVGTMTALYFLAIFVPGFILPYIVKVFRQYSFMASTIIMGLGLVVIIFGHTVWLMCIGAMMAGFGYGVMQPLIYDKTTQTVLSPSKATLALAFVLTANYLSIALTPIIVDFFKEIFGLHGQDYLFPFILNAVMTAAFVFLILLKRRAFVFSIDPSYY